VFTTLQSVNREEKVILTEGDLVVFLNHPALNTISAVVPSHGKALTPDLSRPREPLNWHAKLAIAKKSRFMEEKILAMGTYHGSQKPRMHLM
jgi:hypothetical protein